MRLDLYPGSSCCTGTLVADNVVLTTAHCVPCDASHVYVGWNSNVPSTGRLFAIKDLVPHPQYNQPTRHANDLCFVVLEDRVPVNLARPRELATAAEVTSATSFIAVGFGNTDEGNFGIELEAPVALERRFKGTHGWRFRFRHLPRRQRRTAVFRHAPAAGSTWPA